MPYPLCLIILFQFSLLAGLSPVSIALWLSMFMILIIFSPFLLMSTTIQSSPVFLLRSVCVFVLSLFPSHTSVDTLYLFLRSDVKWLIPLPALSLSDCCRHTTSAFHSTPISNAAMVHTYHLAQLCWIAVNIGGGDSRSVWRFNACPSSCCSFRCGWCLRQHCGWHRLLHRCDILCLCTAFIHIGHFHYAHATPSYCRCPWSLALLCPGYSYGWTRGLRGRACWFSSSPLPCLSGGFRPLWTATAECIVVSIAVGAFLLCVAAERAQLCNAPHDSALMDAGVVLPCVVATCRFAAVLALYVSPSTAMLISAFWVYISEWFDSVSPSPRHDTFFDKSLYHLVSPNDQDDGQCRDLPPLSSSPCAGSVLQQSLLNGYHNSFDFCMDLVPHLLQALSAFGLCNSQGVQNWLSAVPRIHFLQRQRLPTQSSMLSSGWLWDLPVQSPRLHFVGWWPG